MSTKKRGKPKDYNSIHQQILRFILSRPSCTNAEVLAAIGPSISAARAVGQGRNRMKKQGLSGWSTDKLIVTGKKTLISSAISCLHKMGKISHLGKCLWGPPQPKLFNPAESA